MASSNWAQNPYNNKDSYAQSALPKILFGKCLKYCVEEEVFVAETAAEKQCMQNCQEKVYQSFDMYLRASYHFEKNKDYKSFVDVSKYTGMEIEHGHDTASRTRQYGLHANPAEQKNFNREVDSVTRGYKQDAL